MTSTEHESSFVRALYVVLGFTALALGIAGVVLPVLPTTPFVLLAAACFARGSTRFHDWLLAHALFGPMISEWQQYGSCLLYTSPSPRDRTRSRMPSSALKKKK